MAQIVAETLDIETEDVKVVHGNTDVAPYDMGTLGSRSTFHMGNAVERAAEDARAKLAGTRRRSRSTRRHQLRVRRDLQESATACRPETSSAPAPTFRATSPPTPKTGQSDNVTPFWMIGGAGAEVEVDTETGHVRVLRLVNAADRPPAQLPKVAAHASSPAPRSCNSVSRSTRTWSFDGGQVTNASFRRLQDPRLPR